MENFILHLFDFLDSFTTVDNTKINMPTVKLCQKFVLCFSIHFDDEVHDNKKNKRKHLLINCRKKMYLPVKNKVRLTWRQKIPLFPTTHIG